MRGRMFKFEWDPAKAASNRRKHKVDFNDAGAVLVDPLAKSVLDEDHSAFEERWVTIGADQDGRLLVVSHTKDEEEFDVTFVRIISARRAIPKERRQYESDE